MATNIEFIVEDGTGKTDSTSYIDVLFFQQYWKNRGIDFDGEATEDIKAWLNLGTSYIDSTYFEQFQGVRANEDQALQWPRHGKAKSLSNEIINYWQICDTRTSDWIQSDEIPNSLKNALAEIAKVAKDSPDLYGTSDGIKSKRLGPGAITYTDFHAAGEIDYPAVQKYISGLLDGGSIVRL